MTNEFETKQERIQVFLEKHKLDGLLLQRVNNFAWAIHGAPAYVNMPESNGEASLLITNNIEVGRMIQEENLDADWEVHLNGQTFLRPAILERE